jgi:CheY-like chemotaxis protein
MEELLTKQGATVLRASDGREAISTADNCPDIDLIFMDIKLPLVDGYSAVSAIRKRNKKVPIIAISAYTGNEEKEKALSSGFNGYISKPVSIKDLLRTVRDFLV